MKKHILTFALFGALAAPVVAQTSITDAWVRGTVPQQKATGAFMHVVSQQGGRLVQASSPVAGVVEIHEMALENDVMKMRPVQGIDLPAGKAVELKPGGLHVMLMDLKQQVKEGEQVPITLTVEHKDGKRESVSVTASVKPLTAATQPKHGH